MYVAVVAAVAVVSVIAEPLNRPTLQRLLEVMPGPPKFSKGEFCRLLKQDIFFQTGCPSCRPTNGVKHRRGLSKAYAMSNLMHQKSKLSLAIRRPPQEGK